MISELLQRKNTKVVLAVILAILVGLLLLSLIADPIKVAAAGPEFTYTVKWGDTLSEIAYRFETTVDALVKANGIADRDKIWVGQVLTIEGTTAEDIKAPVLFDGQSTGKEYTATYDIGVKPNQVGIVFGVAIEWSGQKSGGSGCRLVWLMHGWYPALKITNGRYEIYDLPASDQMGWIRVLVEGRAQEQAANYSCPIKAFDDVPAWTSNIPSPPDTITVGERRPTGQNVSLHFAAGESVYGWTIELDDGRVCDGGNCYLTSAPIAGTVTSGVINPWPGEVPAGITPWEPN